MSSPIDFGTVKPGTTLFIPFHTFDSNDPAASVTITGLATTDIEIYKDGSVTQRASDAGYTLLDTDGIDFDGTTGIHAISIDLADNTTANFYEAGSQYWVVIASITVDAATVNFVAATFRIGYPGALLDTVITSLTSQTQFILEEGSADADAYNGCICYVHDLASAVQVAIGVVSDYIVTTREVFLVADPGIFTMAAGDNVALFPPALQPVVAGRRLDVDANDRIDVGSWLGTAVTLSSSAPDVNVQSMDADTITASAIATAAIDADAIATDAITAAKIAANAIGASELATDAIGSDQLATSAREEIADQVWDEVLTGATHNVVNSAGRRLRIIQEAGGYSNGAIYIDTVNGAAGTTDFENGVDSNPVSNIADANTLAASLGISRFVVSPGSSITLAAAQDSQVFLGKDWTLALGGQSVSDSHFEGADVSGTATAVTEVHFDHCEMGTCTLGKAHLDECDLTATITLSAAVEYFFVGCIHAGTTIIDFGAAVENTTVHVHDWHGALTIKNMGQAGTDVLHFDSSGGKLTLDNTNTGGTVNMNGTFDFVNSGSGQTINKDGAIIPTLGALGDTAAAGDPTTTDTLVQYIKQLINILVGSAGIAEPAQGAPGATISLADKIGFIYKFLRNRVTSTSTTISVYNDDAVTVDHKSAHSDDTTTYDRGEFISGP